MSHTWGLFRRIYKYPHIKFSSIGRPCFASCLRMAWAEVKQAARLAAIPAPVKSERIAVLRDAIQFEQFNDCWPMASANVAQMQAEIHQLS